MVFFFGGFVWVCGRGCVWGRGVVEMVVDEEEKALWEAG